MKVIESPEVIESIIEKLNDKTNSFVMHDIFGSMTITVDSDLIAIIKKHYEDKLFNLRFIND